MSKTNQRKVSAYSRGLRDGKQHGAPLVRQCSMYSCYYAGVRHGVNVRRYGKKSAGIIRSMGLQEFLCHMKGILGIGGSKT